MPKIKDYAAGFARGVGRGAKALWGGIVGGVGGFLGGLVAPITGVYDAVSGKKPGGKEPSRGAKILGGVAAVLSSPITLPLGAIYSGVGALGGIGLGIYSSMQPKPPLNIGKSIFQVMREPFEHYRVFKKYKKHNIDTNETPTDLRREHVDRKDIADVNLEEEDEAQVSKEFHPMYHAPNAGHQGDKTQPEKQIKRKGSSASDNDKFQGPDQRDEGPRKFK